ncbi:Uncharacterised protein g6027 [Pycnogonum litorale]
MIAEDHSKNVSKNHYRIHLMGSCGTGKTAIVHQFLYEYFLADYLPTVDEIHRADFEVGGNMLTLDILDRGGRSEFAAMENLALRTSHAFIIVFSLTDASTLHEAKRLRDLVFSTKDNKAAVVIVGNKCDLQNERQVTKELADATITVDWENPYIETSAKTNENIVEVFSEALKQAKIDYQLPEAIERRRRSLPHYLHKKHSRIVRPFKRHSCVIS